jgi:diaminobutyrate acetyltransferase
MKIKLRNVRSEDAELLRSVAGETPPLEIHTPYTYWVMCNYQRESSYILTINDEFAGYVLCVSNKNTIFIWQICILSKFRDKKLSHVLIDKIFTDASVTRKNIQMTIVESNTKSLTMFQNACRRHGARIGVIDVIANNHDEKEILYQIDLY